MTSLVLPSFSGEIPRTGAQQLPPTFATKASNCLLLSGELRGLHRPTHWATVSSNKGKVQRAYRIEDNRGEDIWISFTTQHAYFLKGPLINDQYDRYYWTTDTDVPKYNTLERIENGDDPYSLGIPRPATAPTVVPDASGEGPVVVRAYVYTFVSSYGEEGPASDPTVVEGNDDDVWALSSLDNLNVDPDNKDLESKRIYRTVTGTSGAASYFFVAEIPFTNTTYSDNNRTEDVSLNSQLESLNWYAPPIELQGIVAHPNGYLVGFVGNDLYFSEPYRPHAWPPEYVLSTSEKIVGLGIFGSSVAVMTEGYPFIATGVSPASITFTKTRSPEPCRSPFGIVSMPFGVYFPGPDGLMLVSPNGINNATKNLMTRDEWVRARPNTLIAAKYNTQYVAFNSPTSGFILSPDEPNASFVSLEEHWDVDFIDSDVLTGEVYLLNNYDCIIQGECVPLEQVTNGRFEADFGWTKSIATTISGGRACLIDDGDTAGFILQDTVFVADSDYKLSLNISSVLDWAGGEIVALYYGGDENTGTLIGTATILGVNNFIFSTGADVGDGSLHIVSTYTEIVSSFNEVALVLLPDVYWEMQETVGTDAADTSGSGTVVDGTFSANIVLDQPSTVESDPTRKSVKSLPLTSFPPTAAVYSQSNHFNSQAITFSLCFRRSPTAIDDGYICRRDEFQANDRQFGAAIRNSGTQIDLHYANSDTDWLHFYTPDLAATYGIDLNDGNNHIFTGVIDTANDRLETWIDGVLAYSHVGVLSSMQTPGSTYLYVGHARFTGANSLDGDMSDWLFWRRALTTEEVQNLHTSWNPGG